MYIIVTFLAFFIGKSLSASCDFSDHSPCDMPSDYGQGIRGVPVGKRSYWTVDFTNNYPWGVYCSRIEAYLTPNTFFLTDQRVNVFIKIIRQNMVRAGRKSATESSYPPFYEDILRSAFVSHEIPMELIATTTATDRMYGSFAYQVDVGRRFGLSWLTKQPKRPEFTSNDDFRLWLVCVAPREPLHPIMEQMSIPWFVMPRKVLAVSKQFQIFNQTQENEQDHTVSAFPHSVAENAIMDLTPPEYYQERLLDDCDELLDDDIYAEDRPAPNRQTFTKCKALQTKFRMDHRLLWEPSLKALISMMARLNNFETEKIFLVDSSKKDEQQVSLLPNPRKSPSRRRIRFPSHLKMPIIMENVPAIRIKHSRN